MSNLNSEQEYQVWYVEVILPLAIVGTYTYRVPQEFNSLVLVGKRVLVQFGRKRVYSGIIAKLSHNPPGKYQAKYILNILDDVPIVSQLHLNFWAWIAKYYMCNIGEVMKFALPSALKLQSETKIVLRDSENDSITELDEEEQKIIHLLNEKGTCSIEELEKLKLKKNTFKLLKSLFAKSKIWLEEEIEEKYKPKEVKYIRFQKKYENRIHLEDLFIKLESKSTLQMNVLMKLITLDSENKGVNKTEFIKKNALSPSSVKTLVKNSVLLEYTKEIERVKAASDDNLEINNLNAEQEETYNDIKNHFTEKNYVLLEGVTSSGKTHVYIKLIEDVINSGKQVLYLLPEIALTTQLIKRIQAYFGSIVGVTHSKFNQHERFEIWNKLSTGELKIIISPRSGIFLPFNELGLIIVDEEHEFTYKQHDPAPRYQARDAVTVLSKLYNAKVLFGSATPSIESYKNAAEGKYGYTSLMKRYKEVKMPKFEIVDMQLQRKDNLVQGLFSSTLIEAIEKTAELGEQSMLFLNRKGYVPTTECENCSWSPKCINCDITLTYYKRDHSLKCHFCGFQIEPVYKCPTCHNPAIQMRGYGTERIEADLQNILPDLKIARLDQTTTRTKLAFEKIIGSFEQGEIDVLVGTQMLTKGLDFNKLSLVGILDADHALNFPDFRAFERSYQLMVQVGGRAGRRNKTGRVIVQTNKPTHRVIEQVVSHNYKELYHSEIIEREKYGYPPFSRLIRLTIKNKDFNTVAHAAEYLMTLLKGDLGSSIIGPEEPFVGRIRTWYLRNILIKIDSTMSVAKTKILIQSKINLFKSEKKYKSVRIVIDVDPQ